jgi:hypothetical protein
MLRHKLYLMLPDWVDEAVRRCVVALRQLREGGTNVERICGICRSSGEALEVFVTDRTTTVDYLLRRLLVEPME